MTSDVSKLLKEWRAQSRPRLLQEDAARLLKTGLRTYQGWEAGRPMQYPDMLVARIRELQREAGDASSGPGERLGRSGHAG